LVNLPSSNQTWLLREITYKRRDLSGKSTKMVMLSIQQNKWLDLRAALSSLIAAHLSLNPCELVVFC
jgi:hypothetical protein